MGRGHQPNRRGPIVPIRDVDALAGDLLSYCEWDEATGWTLLHPGGYAKVAAYSKGRLGQHLKRRAGRTRTQTKTIHAHTHADADADDANGAGASADAS